MLMQIGNGDLFMNVKYVGGMVNQTSIYISASGTISLTTDDWDFGFICSAGGTNWNYSGKAMILNNNTTQVGLQGTSSFILFNIIATGNAISYTELNSSYSISLTGIELYKYV